MTVLNQRLLTIDNLQSRFKTNNISYLKIYQSYINLTIVIF